MDVSLYFERQYNDTDNSIMLLNGVETTSSLCKTASGIGVGDEKSAILPAYEENPINMGPEWESVNDSTWAMSKTKYSISRLSQCSVPFQNIFFISAIACDDECDKLCASL